MPSRRGLAVALVNARQDRRQDALGEPVAELVERRVDQLARRGGLGLAARALRVGLAVDLVHAEAPDADGARRRGIDVRRHGEVDREQRLAALAAGGEALEAGAVEHRFGGAGGGDQRLDARRPGAEVVEAHGDGVAELVGELLGAFERAVDDHQRHVLARQRLAALPGHRRDADERHAAGRAAHALEQMIGGDLGERQAPLAERRVAVHLVGDAQRLFDQAAEEAAGGGACGTRGARRLERVAQLPLDLALADLRRVEPGGDDEQMLDRAFAVPAAQQVLGLARLRLLAGQHAEDVAAPIAGAAAVLLAVEDLDAVAGR